jgi:ribosome-associated protein
MGEAVGYTDYFVICSGGSPRQTRAIAESVERGLRARGVRAARSEGEREGEWILLDFLDIVVHVFTPEAREFYRLESLWSDVPREPLDDELALSEAGRPR